MNNFEGLVQKLQSNKMRLCQNKEELASIVKSLDIQVALEPVVASKSISSKPQTSEGIQVKNEEKDGGILNKLDHLISKFSKKHNFNFKFLENDEILKENRTPNIRTTINDPEDVISKIKNKQTQTFPPLKAFFLGFSIGKRK